MEISQEWQSRFNSKWSVDINECWIWKGAKLPKGYGIIKIPCQRRQEYAHRLSYQIHIGDIPPGKHVLHRCDNPSCVNPKHLFLGDARTNAQDMRSKGRHLYGELNAQAILTDKIVKKIKLMLSTGRFSQKEIASLFQISQITVSRIHRGLRWSHIQ